MKSIPILETVGIGVLRLQLDLQKHHHGPTLELLTGDLEISEHPRVRQSR